MFPFSKNGITCPGPSVVTWIMTLEVGVRLRLMRTVYILWVILDIVRGYAQNQVRTIYLEYFLTILSSFGTGKNTM